MRLFLFVLLFIPCGTVFAAGQELSTSSRLTLNATTDVSLIPWASVVKDAEKSATVESILGAPLTTRANPDKSAVSVGFSDAAYWFIVPLTNSEDYPLERLLVFDPSWLDDVQVTLVDSKGGRQTFSGGDTRHFTQRSELYRLINFNLSLQPGESTLLVRVATRDPFFVSMSLMGRSGFYKFDARESAYFGLVYGAMLSLLLFNFMLFISARDKKYLAYSAYLAAFIFMHATYNGHTFPLLFPESPELSNWAHSILIYLYSLSGVIFAITFLELKSKLPFAFELAKGFLILLGMSFVATALLGGYQAQVIAAIVWVVLYSVFALFLGIVSLKYRNNAAGYYLSASVAGLCGSSVTALTVMGVVPYSFMTFRAVDFGMLIDAVMLSLALAERLFRVNRLERLRRFFSPAVAEQLLTASSEQLYRTHDREIVVVFLDLRGYTAFTVKHGANEVMRVLGEFHAVMGELIASHGATLERFAGDGMMIFFNDPIEIPEPALKACRMAMEMQSHLEDLKKTWETRGYSLSMGVGIAQGMATIGAIGFEGRRDYAAIGNVTNLAGRLCSEAKGGQIIMSSVVANNIQSVLPVHPIEPLVLKGFAEPVACYEISSPTEQISFTQTNQLALAD